MRTAGADPDAAEEAVVGEVLEVDAGARAVDVDAVEERAAGALPVQRPDQAQSRSRTRRTEPVLPIQTHASARPSEDPGSAG